MIRKASWRRGARGDLARFPVRGEAVYAGISVVIWESGRVARAAGDSARRIISD